MSQIVLKLSCNSYDKARQLTDRGPVVLFKINLHRKQRLPMFKTSRSLIASAMKITQSMIL